MPPPSISSLTDGNGNATEEQPTTSFSCSHFLENQTGNNVSAPTSVSGSLKRKRPRSIEIPNVLREISAETKLELRDLHPKTTKSASVGLELGFSLLKARKNSWKIPTRLLLSLMELRYIIHSYGFFGVYDGHGGRKAADFVAENLHENIFKMLENCTGNAAKEEAVKAGYLKTDQEFLKQGLGSGACCVTALIDGNEIVISNLGDCRAVLSRGGVAEALTNDHRAGQEDERKRIENKGGYVEIHRGAWRVHGVLSVSRSIGDAHLKDWVLAEPDTKTLCFTPDMEYLVLASDGLWEEVGNQEAVDIVMRSCLVEKKGLIGHDRDENDDGFRFLSNSPSSMLQRVSLVKQKKKMGRPCPSKKKTVNRKESKNGFACENESPPPSKTRRISFQMNMKIHSPNQEYKSHDKRSASSGLAAACNELANLAVTRGSLDDITVMIIDLNHFN
ncbi:hypothetical protein HYC85_021225 [Camellia sinensis]|uniref:protein-serine/threonine phosphatase n=1 Tax=Camellia sinensis TaxID=4442 RepID=A0A7J7GL03_CAMSI|nr:hypothetical protein HYC85_021225 [Camellia sinensis]